MNKFEIGQTYKLYSITNELVYYTIIDRIDNRQVIVKENKFDNDNENVVFNKYDILIECGIEKILIWEYRNVEACIYANEYLK